MVIFEHLTTVWLVPDRSLSVCPDLQLKAAEVNKTLSRKDGTPDKSLEEMKEEIQAMLAEMRKRQLGGKKGIAEEEMGYGHTQTNKNVLKHARTHKLLDGFLFS